MPLVVFDIDGTLAQTVGIDDPTFAGAFDTALGLRGFDCDWGAYPHATDSSLVVEIVKRARGTPPTDAEVHAVREAYFAKLREHAKVKGRFRATRGAGELLTAIRKRSGWGVAIATGGWRESALIKLTAAGLFTFGIPSVYADDALSREAITLKAIILATGFAFTEKDDRAEVLLVAGERFGGIVYVGDGVWDVRTARELGLGFLGVRPEGDEAGVRKLRAEGARAFVSDFEPAEELIELLQAEAESPPWR